MGFQGSSELLGSVLEGHVNGVTVLGRLVLGELGDLVVPVGHGVLEVLASLLGVLLDLGSVGSDVLVHAVDLGVGGRCPRAGGSLPAGDGKTKVVSLLSTIGVDHAKGLLVA